MARLTLLLPGCKVALTLRLHQIQVAARPLLDSISYIQCLVEHTESFFRPDKVWRTPIDALDSLKDINPL
jgi:hypothetical protein